MTIASGTVISDKVFDEERALYRLKYATVKNCRFTGPTDGESPLKEARGIEVFDCYFALRYPLWHVRDFSLSFVELTAESRAPLWYCQNGTVAHAKFNSVKALRDSERVDLVSCQIVSPEFGWKCRDIKLDETFISAEYLFLDAQNIRLHNVRMNGKYSFQYIENLVIETSVLDTKDAFWHTKNAIVRNTIIKGEYLGWYSENLTLENCTIEGTQPLCHCKGLKLINCTMINCDLAFEDSEVEAQVKGKIDSIYAPKSGHISCDEVGEIIDGEQCHIEVPTKNSESL